MNTMTDKLMKIDYDIKKILGDKRYLKNILIYLRIKKFKKELNTLLNKTEYTSVDIINLCQLIHVGKILGYCELKTDTISTEISRGTEYKWPIIGLIKMNINNSFAMEIKAHMDSEVDLDGQIDINWIVGCGSVIQDTYPVERNISYNYTTKIIDTDSIPTNNKDVSDLMIKTYKIIPNIFTVFIENILDGLKEKYLK